MKCLLTGVSGFVGRYLADHLCQAGDRVLGCTEDGTWELPPADPLKDRVELVAWNLEAPPPPATLRRIRDYAPDCVFHLAAISNPRDCRHERALRRANRINVEGTLHLLDVARALRSAPTVLFCSSAHVYAPVTARNPYVDEQAPLQPVSAYGRTKLQAEQLCLQAARDGLPVVVVRPFPHTGPGQRPDFMLPAWTCQFAADNAQPMRVITVDCHLDLCDVRDVVSAYRLLVVCRALGIFNVGSGIPVCGQQILELLQTVAGHRRAVLETRPGRHQHPIARIGRLTEATGWVPQIPLVQTVADSLAYWRNQAASR